MSESRRRDVRRTGLFLSALLVAGPILAACGSGTSDDAKGSDALPVVATTTQVADFARTIGGDHVQITQLLQPNVDPHDFEPSPADLQAIGKAKVVVENGVDLESWLDDTIEAAGFDGTTVDSSKGVTLRKGAEEDEHAEEDDHADEEEGHGHDHGVNDPHIWLNPLNAKVMAGNIEQAFAKADPANKNTYASNLEKYQARLDELDNEIKRQIATIPATDRKVVTNHDAFGYYLDRYDLTFVGSVIPSLDTSAELAGKQLDALVDKIEAQHVKAVFSESSLPPKTAEAIGKRANVHVVAGEDSLFGDTLGPEGSDGATYIAMTKHNTKTIVDALGA